MKLRNILFPAFTFLILWSGCQKQSDDVNYTAITDLSAYHMKILPPAPSAADNIRLVIMDDCQYNLLFSVTRTGNTIDIEKRFNSMMKMACLLRNDTITIGKLSAGDYRVNYRLVDLSTLVPDKIALAVSFDLNVSK